MAKIPNYFRLKKYKGRHKFLSRKIILSQLLKIQLFNVAKYENFDIQLMHF